MTLGNLTPSPGDFNADIGVIGHIAQKIAYDHGILWSRPDQAILQEWE